MIEPAHSKLFSPELIFIEDATTQEDVFKQVSARLETLGAVKPTFYDNLTERERNYPTGIDMSVVNTDYPNVAIPHTEGEFVNTRRIVPIKLNHPITFHNMIDPEQTFPVKFLFMILNNDPEGQANVLAQIMDFLTTTPQSELENLFNATDTDSIYQLLATHFKN
ncbi:PTS sugar transporter subunit IIA [Lacticaseibacillus saniviri]|nr:PTS sugar transporter subunit IIA [Lacticaseibacillus saniviri]MCG4281164.1 PTS sugar transporter subunit IIA [Lacticaseibacillus saniviri]